jgi:unsaturated rhamnogalacturonyl hydrolase
MQNRLFPKLIACLLLFTAYQLSAQKTVTLDYYYNNEYQMHNGQQERYHYTWEDKTVNGYSQWGDIFKQLGARLENLPTAPTAETLSKTQVYIISDPDTYKETANPHFMNETDAGVIANWVKKGGVLVLMANDSANAELPHFNILAGKFGIHFTDKVRNSVLKDLSVGKITVPDGHPIFHEARTLYLKGICTITVKSPAMASISDKGDIIMAIAHYGKGTVFAIGDPWIYNEYITSKRLTPEFQNEIAAKELSEWLLKQAK